ncbi:MAG: hypothetical protein ACYCUY_07650 [Acidithiobacillus sp.]|jgi:hypothetical protein
MFVCINSILYLGPTCSASVKDATHITSTVSVVTDSGLLLGKVNINPDDATGPFFGYWHAPRWYYCRRTIPITAIYVAKIVGRLRSGKPVSSSSFGVNGYNIFQHTDDEDLGEYGINSLSKKEIEDITGYSRQQLHDFDKPW